MGNLNKALLNYITNSFSTNMIDTSQADIPISFRKNCYVQYFEYLFDNMQSDMFNEIESYIFNQSLPLQIVVFKILKNAESFNFYNCCPINDSILSVEKNYIYLIFDLTFGHFECNNEYFWLRLQKFKLQYLSQVSFSPGREMELQRVTSLLEKYEGCL